MFPQRNTAGVAMFCRSSYGYSSIPGDDAGTVARAQER